MIAANIRVNNEFYVAPVYTQLAVQGKEVGTFSVGTDTEGMYGLGTPADLERFLACGFQPRLHRERRSVRRAA